MYTLSSYYNHQLRLFIDSSLIQVKFVFLSPFSCRLKTAEDDARIEKALNDRLQKSINDQALEVSKNWLNPHINFLEHTSHILHAHPQSSTARCGHYLSI